MPAIKDITLGLLFLILMGLFMALDPFPARAQGSLTPPGAPAPSMRTLTQVEPRTPVNPMTGQLGVCQLLISKPGSYYLTGNLTGVANLDCIRITTSGVTLDLNGFCLTGVTGSQNAIYVTKDECVIRNGSIRNWGGYGVHCGSYTRLENLMICNNLIIGAYVGGFCQIVGCYANKNQGSGFWVEMGTTLLNCTANDNQGNGASVNGSNGLVQNCVFYNNKYSGVSQNYGSGWIIQGNSMIDNGYSGAAMVYGGIILNNSITGSLNGPGIETSVGHSRIEGNHVTDCKIGITLGTNGKNVMINNSVVACTTPYKNTDGNNATSAGPVTTTAAATNPFGNINIP